MSKASKYKKTVRYNPYDKYLEQSHGWMATIFADKHRDAEPVYDGETIEEADYWPEEQIDHRVRNVLEQQMSLFRYARGRWEICPKTGRAHIQLYVQFHTVQRHSKMMNLFGKSGWYQPAYSDGAPSYGMKAQDFPWAWDFELGHEEDYVTMGQRTDLDSDVKEIEEKKGIISKLEIAKKKGAQHKYQFLQWVQNAVIEELPMLTLKPVPFEEIDNDNKCSFVVIYGPEGTGKSECMREMASRLSVKFGWKIFWQDNQSCFKSYNQEPILCLEEMDPKKFPPDELDKLCDKYRPMKMSSRNDPKLVYYLRVVIVTTNYDPKTWYEGVKGKSILRRITDFIETWKDESVAPQGPKSLAETPHSLDTAMTELNDDEDYIDPFANMSQEEFNEILYCGEKPSVEDDWD